ncbi:iron response transcriptional regulator IrrA [Govanella unica]|uniref:Ferric uptake regulation protein n=1 Tax=Govanella unica TaxID=2975056 RepID=A0A9X3Z7U9_9PROT|nr:transcriptional repressor [Govania unica]
MPHSVVPADGSLRPFAQSLHRLRQVGLRPTRQRLALARLLFDMGYDRHMTAEALHEEAVRAGARVSLATVYNTLHQFTDNGLLREVVVDCGRAYFDTNVTDHHHFFYEDGGRLEDIPAGLVEISNIPQPLGGTVSRVDIIIRVK